MTFREWFDNEGRFKCHSLFDDDEIAREGWDAATEELTKEITSLRALVKSLSDRCHGQSELLSKRAEK